MNNHPTPGDDTECIVAKAIRDGGIDAAIDHEAQLMYSKVELYKLNPVYPPGFKYTPWKLQNAISWHQSFGFKWVNVCGRYVEVGDVCEVTVQGVVGRCALESS